MQWVQENVAAAPPLTDEQKAALHSLLGPVTSKHWEEKLEVLTFAQVAEQIGVSVKTVKLLIEAGELAISERGRKQVVHRWAVDAYLYATNTTFCVACRGWVTGKLESKWLTPRPTRK